MKKYHLFSVSALIMGVCMVSCQNEDVVKPSLNGTQDVKVSIVVPSLKGKASTRAEEAPYVPNDAEGKPTTVTPKLNSARIFFVEPKDGVVPTNGDLDPESVIKRVVYLTTNSDGTLHYDGQTEQDVNTTATGVVIKDVPAAATVVYVIGNEDRDTDAILADEVGTATSAAIAPEDKFSKLQALMVRIDEQQNATKDLHLYGWNEVTPVNPDTPSEPVKAEVTVSVKPRFARIEIAGVTADQSVSDPIKVTSFDLDGIYINNTFTMINLVNDKVYPTASDNILAFTDAAAFDATKAPYSTPRLGLGLTLTGATTYAPATTGNIWGFNVVAPCNDTYTSGHVTAKDKAEYFAAFSEKDINGKLYGKVNACPQIVLKLKNVKVNSNLLEGGATRFVTVTSYKNNSDNKLLQHFDPNCIYKISSIVFNANHITKEPGGDPVRSAQVIVEVESWTTMDVTPGFD